MKTVREFKETLSRIRRGVEPADTSKASLERSRKAAERRREAVDDVKLVSDAMQIVTLYRSRGLRGKALADRLVRHAKTLSGPDPAVAVELLERATAIEWEAKQAC